MLTCSPRPSEQGVVTLVNNIAITFQESRTQWKEAQTLSPARFSPGGLLKKEAVAFSGLFPPSLLLVLKLWCRGRLGETNLTCPAKTSKVSAEAASLSCRHLGVSLWCFPTLARRCQCCFQRRPSGRSGRLCPSVGPSDPQEPPLQQAKS